MTSLRAFPITVFQVTSSLLRTSNHSIADSDWKEANEEHNQVPDHLPEVLGHEIRDQSGGDAVYLMGSTDKDEGGQQDVDHGVVGNQD